MSYLINDKCLDSVKEETKLALLCMQYLTFDFFETDIFPDSMLQSIQLGHYAFLAFASLHWYHYLDTAFTSFKTDDLAELDTAINDFFEMYERVNAGMRKDKRNK